MARAIIDAPVWGYRVELDGQPIYFGIGTRRRLRHPINGRSHNRALRGLARKCPERLEVIPTTQAFASRADAQQWERDMIAFYGRRDMGLGRLVNHTNGGDGSDGKEASRRNQALVAAGRHPWQQQRFKEAQAKRIRETNLARAVKQEHPFQRADVRAACSERMRQLAGKRSRALVAEGAHQFQGDRNPMRRRKMAGVRHHSQKWKPWDRPQTTAKSAATWAMADELYEFFLEHRHKQHVPWRWKLAIPSKDALKAIAQWFRTGWIPEQDLDWSEWARAYRASTLKGEHTHGPDPSGP